MLDKQQGQQNILQIKLVDKDGAVIYSNSITVKPVILSNIN